MLNIKIYPNSYGDGSYTAEEIRRGMHWVHADIECPHCGFNQPVTMTNYLGGPCYRCGQLTAGEKNSVNTHS